MPPRHLAAPLACHMPRQPFGEGSGLLAAVNQGGSSPSGPAGQPPRRRRRSPRDLVVYFVCCGAGRGARNVPTCCNWGRLRRLTCRKKNMEFRRAFPRRLQRGAVTSVCLNAPIGSRSCRFDGARGWASLFWSYVVAARAHLSLAFADPARNAACGLLPVLICRSQAGSSELEQSKSPRESASRSVVSHLSWTRRSP